MIESHCFRLLTYQIKRKTGQHHTCCMLSHGGYQDEQQPGRQGTEKSNYLRTTSCQSAGDHASHTLARIPQGHHSGPALSALYLFLKLLPNITAGNVDLEASLSSVSLTGDGNPSPSFCEPEHSRHAYTTSYHRDTKKLAFPLGKSTFSSMDALCSLSPPRCLEILLPFVSAEMSSD